MGLVGAQLFITRGLWVQARAGRRCLTPPGSRGSGVRGRVCLVPGTVRREGSTRASGRTCSPMGRALGSFQDSSDTQARLGPVDVCDTVLPSSSARLHGAEEAQSTCFWLHQQQLQNQTCFLPVIKPVRAANGLTISQSGAPDASRLLGHDCAEDMAQPLTQLAMLAAHWWTPLLALHLSQAMWGPAGDWQMGKQHGQGACSYADGSCYQGAWQEGLRCAYSSGHRADHCWVWCQAPHHGAHWLLLGRGIDRSADHLRGTESTCTPGPQPRRCWCWCCVDRRAQRLQHCILASCA